jgi:hypothetical protein
MQFLGVYNNMCVLIIRLLMRFAGRKVPHQMDDRLLLAELKSEIDKDERGLIVNPFYDTVQDIGSDRLRNILWSLQESGYKIRTLYPHSPFKTKSNTVTCDGCTELFRPKHETNLSEHEVSENLVILNERSCT